MERKKERDESNADLDNPESQVNHLDECEYPDPWEVEERERRARCEDTHLIAQVDDRIRLTHIERSIVCSPALGNCKISTAADDSVLKREEEEERVTSKCEEMREQRNKRDRSTQ